MIRNSIIGILFVFFGRSIGPGCGRTGAAKKRGLFPVFSVGSVTPVIPVPIGPKANCSAQGMGRKSLATVKMDYGYSPAYL
ncbi:hypothetical protein [Bacillus cereus group sp. BfR-BA-01383]|uniref:hypothetical protein n=1 Tax=Bacillus cereus group sp. BfR-BA-01383 TaxID=2920327 RepID=UPI001F594176|nr:hypothetical protein [Bacillus cereus group sp. BfR-BA-01383]